MDAVMAEVLTQVRAAKAVVLKENAVLEALPLAKPDISTEVCVMLVYALVLFVFNWGVRLLIVKPIGCAILGAWGPKVNKFSQSVMEAIFYFGFAVLGAFVVPCQPWVWPSVNWWQGFESGSHFLMRPDVKLYYLSYLGRYIQMTASVMLEPKRKDFPEMLSHHLVTIAIVSVSYIWGLNRVGVVTMLLLDPADVPLHVAKVCKYIAEAKDSSVWQMFADRWFELFAILFFITRLVLYGYVVYSCFTEGAVLLPSNGGAVGQTCFFMLLILLFLQVYWFFLILKVAFKLMREGQSVEDVRSDDEDERTPSSTKNQQSPRSGSTSSWLILVFVAAGFSFIILKMVLDLDGAMHELYSLVFGLIAVLLRNQDAIKLLPQQAPNLSRDFVTCGILTFCIFILNWGCRLVFVEPWARHMLSMKRMAVEKFAQSFLEAVMYSTFAVIGFMVVPSQEWVWPSSSWWKGFAEGGHEVMRADLRCYYILYSARYIQAIISVLLEPKRKDFIEMLVHHFVTVMVIYISYVYGWNRIGVVVMVLFDPADVPLHLAKLCKYTFESTGRKLWQFCADRLFEIFALVFFITRLALFGYVCWSAHIEATRFFPKGLPEWTCVALLYMLLVLQLYWFSLIIRVAVKLARGQSVEDIRSDDEDELEQSGEVSKEKSKEKKKDK